MRSTSLKGTIINKKYDYDNYKISNREKILYISIAIIGIYILGYIFYHSLIIPILFCPLAMLYPKIKSKQIMRKRKEELNDQFKEMLYSLSSSLAVGKSVQSAFYDVLRDMKIIYTDNNTPIIVELNLIIRRLELNESIQVVLLDFARRCHLEDINNFVDVFLICQKTGGNLVEAIRNTSNIINDKIEIKQEIHTMLAAKRLEQKVLNLVPILIIVTLTYTSYDYIEPLFTTTIGRAVMTVALALLVVAYFISKKIMDIKV